MLEAERGVHPSGWTILLTDWKNERARVTITLRNGANFTGRVVRVNSGIYDAVQLEDHVDRRDDVVGARRRHQVLHDIDMTEIVAVSAESQR